MYIKKLNSDLEEDTLYSLVERIDQIIKNSDLIDLLYLSKEKYGLKNLSYAGFNMGEMTIKKPYVTVTYKEDWVKHYNDKLYYEVDPVLKIINKTILPIDWQSFDISNPKIRKFFAEAKDAGVGRNGISIPVRGRAGDLSVFSLTFDGNERDWLQFKKQFMRDFQVLSVHFHQSVLNSNKITPPEFNLSDRELEVLYWAGCGKTGEEISLILKLTKRGIRFHVSNLMFKLNASNISHAVGKGIYFGLVKPPR
jgi:DNA-binding CsgD family transcriptional regulator